MVSVGQSADFTEVKKAVDKFKEETLTCHSALTLSVVAINPSSDKKALAAAATPY